MISKYWSNSKFADRLRVWSGMNEQPHAATWEDWQKYEAECKCRAPTAYAAIEFLDKVQRVIHWVPEKFSSAIYWVHNALNGSNTLRTHVKLGGYADLTTKIPDALMYAVIDFVEEECFWMNIMSTEEPGLLHNYANQSYVRRKLFPIEVPDYIRGAEGIKWLEFQIREGGSKDSYEPIIAAYRFAKSRYFTFDPWEESGYNEADRAGILPPIFSKTDDSRHKYYKKVHELEAVFDALVTEHCVNIVKLRKGLWT